MRIDREEFKQIIREEALKIKKRRELQLQKEAIEKELSALMNENTEPVAQENEEMDPLEEGLFGRMVGYRMPKQMSRAIEGATDAQSLKRGVLGAIGTLKNKKVEWVDEMMSAIKAKASEVGMGPDELRALGGAMQKMGLKRAAAVGSPSGGKGGVGGAYAGM